MVTLGVAGEVHLARYRRRPPRPITSHRRRQRRGTKLTQINTWYAQQMAGLIARLKATRDATGATLFDNTLVLWCNALAKGNTHSRQDAPYVLAGTGGGPLATGRYLNHEGQGLAAQQPAGLDPERNGHPRHDVRTNRVGARARCPASCERTIEESRMRHHKIWMAAGALTRWPGCWLALAAPTTPSIHSPAALAAPAGCRPPPAGRPGPARPLARPALARSIPPR